MIEIFDSVAYLDSANLGTYYKKRIGPGKYFPLC